MKLQNPTAPFSFVALSLLMMACGSEFHAVENTAPVSISKKATGSGTVRQPVTPQPQPPAPAPAPNLMTPLPRPVPHQVQQPAPRPVPGPIPGPAPAPAPAPAPVPAPTSGRDTTPKPGTLTALTPSGPITLESNRTYSGLRITNPNGHCIYGLNVTNVRITKSEIGPCGDGTKTEAHGIFIHSSSNIQVDHNIIHDVSTGIAGVKSTNFYTHHNYIYGIRGPMPAGQIVLYDEMYGAGNKILCNIGANTEHDNTEDNINTWKSKGTPESPIEIAYNRIRGGHSKSGTGINIGDGVGSQYIDVHDNTIVNVNNAGIGVSSGHYFWIRDNKIYNNGPYSSVGISVRNWYEGCGNIQVTNNRVWAYDHIWGMNGPWHFLDTKECSNVTNSGNNFGDTTLSAAIFDEEYPQCF